MHSVSADTINIYMCMWTNVRRMETEAGKENEKEKEKKSGNRKK